MSGQVLVAARFTASLCSDEGAVPVKVTVSLSTLRPKSGIGTLAVKTGSALEKSSDRTTGST
ncbi:Uncharacterised protein [Mycobacterium tuberculosis]|nr:Uncharacterised protein [Mycobacterium tuberculosis]COX85798.1 Uncharacterised protein [Mycobacterium tuberculosis]COY45698.1 Uncharacterised protein [Mycobacterium tuberculosis]